MPACAVHHVAEGPEGAPAVVLVNSLGADLSMWEPQLAALREGHRVVRFDTRGHGASPAPPGPYSLADLGGDVLALLDRLGLERASVCGVSLGGAIALWLGANAPERVDRLAACFSSARFGGGNAWSERAALVRAEGTGAVAEAVVGRWFTAATAERDPALIERMREMVAATPAEGYAACCEVVGEVDLIDELGAIAAPTLAISGSEDPATPPEHGRRIAAGIPGASFAEVPGAAHLGNVERPEAVTALLLGHLGGDPVQTETEEASS